MTEYIILFSLINFYLMDYISSFPNYAHFYQEYLSNKLSEDRKQNNCLGVF